MKKRSWLPLATILSSFGFGLAIHAQPVLNLDGQPINDYVSIGEFETAGDREGWNSAGGGANPTLTVANGVLRITTTSGDPWFYRVGLANIPAELTTVEVRLKLVTGTGSGWEIFWGSTEPGKGGFAGGREFAYSVLEDGEYHLLQFDMSPVLNGYALTDFRIDASGGAGVIADVDYVRVGIISPDTDGDGLPDTVETGTGVFVSRRDTGTNPAKADTDGDGVNDGTEVQFGTDPNNAAEFPVPSIKYPISEAVYVVSTEIAANVPAVNNGTATSFAVAPTLPAGLALNTANGTISGTPTAAAASTEYKVTATFMGGRTAEAILKIEVRNPYIEMAISQYSLKVGQFWGPIAPSVRGPAPQSFQISPALPDGLTFEPTTGEMSGTPTAYMAAGDYTISAVYSAYPNATAMFRLSVLEDPVLTVDPTDSLLSYWSFGEYEDAADLTGLFRNSIAPFIVDAGVLQVQTTGGDPYFGKSFTLDHDYRFWEFRMKVTAGNPVPFKFYWAENVAGRNNLSELTAYSISGILTDGAYHVYRMDFTRATEGKFTVMRFDPGDGADAAMEFDYIRLGGFDPVLNIAQQPDGSLRIAWSSSASAYALQSATTPAGTWAKDPAVPVTSGNELVVTVQPQAGPKFYRLFK